MIPLEQLQPIQAAGVIANRILSLPEDAPPICAALDIRTIGQEPPKYFLVDGTHRSYRAHMKGEAVIEAQILETDEHVANFGTPALVGCLSLAAVVERFETTWQPLLEAAGIDSVATLPIRHRPDSEQPQSNNTPEDYSRLGNFLIQDRYPQLYDPSTITLNPNGQ